MLPNSSQSPNVDEKNLIFFLEIWSLRKSGILRQNILFVFHVGCSVFCYGEISPNFDLEKYDFNLFKGFFMEKKMAQIRQVWMNFFFQIARFLWEVSAGIQEYWRILVFKFFNIQYVAKFG
jgi:hypothetical protein